jgi:hypothetical protein
MRAQLFCVSFLGHPNKNISVEICPQKFAVKSSCGWLGVVVCKW